MKFIFSMIRQKPYRYWIAPAMLIYFALMLAVYSYIYNGNVLAFFNGFPLWYTLGYTVMILVTSILLGVLLVLFVAKIREVRAKSLGLGVTGLVFGSLAAGCPGCIFGLFPILLGMFGIGGTLAILPFNGLEFQMLTVAFLLAALYFIARETDVSCEVPR